MTKELNLKEEDQKQLKEVISKGKWGIRVIKRAEILLLSEKGKSLKEIREKTDCCNATITNTKRRYREEGLEYILQEKPRPGQPNKLDGIQEAKIMATACTKPPNGRANWTLELLARRFVSLNVSKTTIGRTLKKRQ